MLSSRKEKEKERRRVEILSAAQRVFDRKGYQSTSMGEVAKEAEFSKGTLYLYFESKFELFAELSNLVLSNVVVGFEAICAESIPGRIMVGKMLRFWANLASENIRQFRLAMSWIASDERADGGGTGAICHRERVGLVIGLLTSAIDRGKADRSILRMSNSSAIACQLWSGMMGALLFSSRNEELAEDFPVPLQAEGFMDDFVDLLESGLGVKSQ